MLNTDFFRLYILFLVLMLYIGCYHVELLHAVPYSAILILMTSHFRFRDPCMASGALVYNVLVAPYVQL